jgi:hypothetical protein
MLIDAHNLLSSARAFMELSAPLLELGRTGIKEFGLSFAYRLAAGHAG